MTSAAVALEMDGATIRAARIALGGVGTVPWRVRAAEAVLQGTSLDRKVFDSAAEAALVGATPQHGNAFKVGLAKQTLVRALTTIGGMA